VWRRRLRSVLTSTDDSKAYVNPKKNTAMLLQLISRYTFTCAVAVKYMYMDGTMHYDIAHGHTYEPSLDRACLKLMGRLILGTKRGNIVTVLILCSLTFTSPSYPHPA
jgi:hypothetical protein